MKKVLVITTIYSTINSFLVPHIEWLRDNGYYVDCCCNVDKDIDENLKKKGVSVFNVPFSRNPLDIKNIAAFRELLKIQKQNNYEVIHVHTPVASIYGRLLKIIYKDLIMIYTAHGFHFYKGAPKFNWMTYFNIEKTMSRLTDAIITMNNEDFNIAKEKFHSKSVHYINGIGVDIEEYSRKSNSPNNLKQELSITDEDIVISVIAELSKRKNHMQILEAVNSLVKNRKKIKLLLAGNGQLKESIEEYISRNGLKDNVSLLGYRDDIPNILEISDIVGLFSYHEGLPRNLMEAMIAKKPIICTDIRGNNDLVKHGINGLLVPIDDIRATEESIEKLYSDKKLRNNMGEEGFKIIKNDYCIENILKSMEEIYLNSIDIGNSFKALVK